MNNNQLCIVLDLDQTLISAEKPSDITNLDPVKKNNFTSHNMDDLYVVFERPGLQKFLAYIFENCNVNIWTAASKDYAMFIINNIILGNHKNRKLNYVLFSYHCDISQDKSKSGCTKDLNTLWDLYNIKGFNKNNTVIVDDYVEDVFDKQKNNCIIAPEFKINSANSANDTFLTDLIPYLRDYRGEVTDLTTACNKKFSAKILD